MSASKWKVGGTYELRNGSEAVILEEHEGRLFGRFFGPVTREWMSGIWDAQSGERRDSPISHYALAPPTAPRIMREVWVNIYPDESASLSFSRGTGGLISSLTLRACIPITIDVPEGYGLDKDQPPILVRAD